MHKFGNREEDSGEISHDSKEDDDGEFHMGTRRKRATVKYEPGH